VKKPRLIIFLVFWAVVQCLLLSIYMMMPGSGPGPHLVPLVAFIGAPLGPLAGGVARFAETSCVQASLVMFAYCFPFAAVAAASLALRKSASPLLRIAAMVAWTVGCLGWMAGAFFSFGYALG
jgi:hypothetical protein